MCEEVRLVNVAVRVLQFLLALAFLAHGSLFLFPPPEMAQQMNASIAHCDTCRTRARRNLHWTHGGECAIRRRASLTTPTNTSRSRSVVRTFVMQARNAAVSPIRTDEIHVRPDDTTSCTIASEIPWMGDLNLIGAKRFHDKPDRFGWLERLLEVKRFQLASGTRHIQAR